MLRDKRFAYSPPAEDAAGEIGNPSIIISGTEKSNDYENGKSRSYQKEILKKVQLRIENFLLDILHKTYHFLSYHSWVLQKMQIYIYYCLFWIL